MQAPPTVAELEHLPLRAIVALAARCSQRMRADLDLPLDKAPDRARHMAAVDAAIRAARDFATGEKAGTHTLDASNAAGDAQGATPDDWFGVAPAAAQFAALAAWTADNADVRLVSLRAERPIRACLSDAE